MQNFREFLKESCDIILNEDLGNLKYIDKDLQTAIKRDYKRLAPGLGRDSIVKKDIPFNKPIDVERYVFDNKDILGAVVKVNGEQAAIITLSPRFNKWDPSKLEIGNYSDSTGRKKDFVIKIKNDFHVYTGKFQNSMDYFGVQRSIPKFKQWIKLIMTNPVDPESTKSNVVSVDLIYVDEKRMEKRKQRVKQKIGAIAMMSPHEVERKLRGELNSKLEKLKISKVKIEANTIDELKEVINKSIPKSIKLKGFIYNFERTRYFDDGIKSAITGKSRDYMPELQYRMSSSETNRRSKIYDEVLKEIRELTGDDEEQNKKIKESLRKRIPADSFNVKIKIDNNMKFTVDSIVFI